MGSHVPRSSPSVSSVYFHRPLIWHIQCLTLMFATFAPGGYQSIAVEAIPDAAPDISSKIAAFPLLRLQAIPPVSVHLTSHLLGERRWRKTEKSASVATTAFETKRASAVKKKNEKCILVDSAPAKPCLLLHAMGFNHLEKTGCVVLALAIAMSYKLWDHIPVQDRSFAIVYPLYLGIINRIRFQRNHPARAAAMSELKSKPLLFQGKGDWFITYINVFAIIGMLLPLVLCLTGPTIMAAPAASHTMLLFAQVLTEAMTANPWMHEQPRVMVPIGFNAYRMLSLWSWVKRSWDIGQRSLRREHHLLSLSTQMWAVFGFSLSVINFVAWSYNLFVFLLLRVVPQYWDTNTFPTADVKWKGQLVPVLG